MLFLRAFCYLVSLGCQVFSSISLLLQMIFATIFVVVLATFASAQVVPSDCHSGYCQVFLLK